MKKSYLLGALFLVGAWSCAPSSEKEEEVVTEEEIVIPDNSLTDEERADGWMLLFDGESMEGWRAFNGDTTPSNWIIEDGAMKGLGATGGSDIGGDIVFWSHGV